jgi:microcystin-dependent protein
LRSDGTNIVEQLNHITGSLSIGGNASVTGNVSVTGTTTLLDDLILNSLSGTSGQVVVSQGAGNPPVWGNAFVAGMIMMWSGTIATIPSGWVLCNGSSGTPDLRNRFIIGAHSDDAGVAKTTITGSPTQTGGSKDAIVVSHSHTATTTATDSGHTHPVPESTQLLNSGNGFATGVTATARNVNSRTGSANITASTTVDSAGSSGTNANLVPYFALAYIMKT